MEDDGVVNHDHTNGSGDIYSTLSSASIVVSLKLPRKFHGSSNLYGRWKHAGLIASGTGVATIFQISTMLLADPL